MLDRLEATGLKLALDKCKSCQSSVKYVGHIFSKDSISTDPEKVNAVTTWSQPTNYRELKRFLGFAGFYHQFVWDYATIIKPLKHFTRGCQMGRAPQLKEDPKLPGPGGRNIASQSLSGTGGIPSVRLSMRL